MESLAALFGLIISSSEEIEEKRSQLQLDGDRLFESMDLYRSGYLTANAFSHWVSQNCGYNIPDADLIGLCRQLDTNNDYRITRDEFIAAVSVPQQTEEDQENEEQDGQLDPEELAQELEQQKEQAA